MTLSTMVLNLTGFVSMWVLLFRYLRIERYLALLGALLFQISSANVISVSSHPQLSTIYMVPIFGIIIFEIFLSSKNRFYMSIFLGIFTSLIFLNSVYIFYGLLIGFIIFSTFYTFFNLPKFLYNIKVILLNFFVFLLSFLSLTSPMITKYYDLSKKIGFRSWEEVDPFILPISNWINVGDNNFLWNPILQYLSKSIDLKLDFHEVTYNPTPIMWLVIISSLFIIRNHKLFRYLFLTGILTLVVSTKFMNFSLWEIIYQIPFFDGIRAVSRINLIGNLIFIIVISIFLNIIYTKFKKIKIFVIFIFLLIIIEQIQIKKNFNIDYKDQLKYYSTANQKPNSCLYFYINSDLTKRPQAFLQMDSFLVSYLSKSPTLNGYSGKTPLNWSLNSVGDPSYIERISNYVTINKLNIQTICELDLTTLTWYPPITTKKGSS